MRDDEGRICHFTSCSPPLLSVGYDDDGIGMERGGNGTRRAALSRTMRERERERQVIDQCWQLGLVNVKKKYA